MQPLLLGADPEVFMRNEQGLVRSAHGVIPGTKENPHPVKRGAIQVDGLALEFNIIPSDNCFDFNRNINTVLHELCLTLPEGFDIDIKGHHFFPQEYMDSLPAESKILGCDPDFNAWTGLPNPAPNAATNLRTAAGHIHFGWSKKEIMDDWFFQLCQEFTKQLDCTVGLYCYFLDNDKIRKKLYGKAGAFRPKPYGLEYRTPPNIWITDYGKIEKIYRLCHFAFNEFSKGTSFIRGGKGLYLSSAEVVGLINNTLEGKEKESVEMEAKSFLRVICHV